MYESLLILTGLNHKTEMEQMMKSYLLTIATIATVSLPLAAYAQGTIRGAEEGARQGNEAAGPLGGIVGGAVGAATGTVGGILGVEERPRFREYVHREHRNSFRYHEDIRVGMVVPNAGIALYPVPPEYHIPREYRYTFINDRPMIVDPRTRRVVEIIE